MVNKVVDNCNRFQNKFIITGGPGFGKTSVVNELKRIGFDIFNEVALEIINEEIISGGNILPWINRYKFDKKIIKRMIKQYTSHDSKKIAFFDRGLPDLIGWRLFDGLKTTDVNKYVNDYRYERLVFLTEKWPEIFVSKSQRPYSFEQACEINDYLKTGYISRGYEVKILPKTDIKSRANYILENINTLQRKILT